MEVLILSLVGLLIVLFGITIILIGFRSALTGEIDRRLQEYVVDPGLPEARWPMETIASRPELSGSFTRRTLVPAFQRLGGLFGRLTPGRSIAELNRQLYMAGNPLGMSGRDFYGIRILFMILGVLLAYLIASRSTAPVYLFGALLVAYITYILPRYWLRSRIRSRQDRVRRELPDALDILSVCADAGLGFDQSLQRLSEGWKTLLGIEFGRVVAEMNMGLSRAEALRNLADRLQVQELSSFVAVILQSSELGMSIADTLHAQATQMRIERRFWAQEQARKIPLKMIFPLMFLILPATMIVVIGPAIPGLVNLFSIFRGG